MTGMPLARAFALSLSVLAAAPVCAFEEPAVPPLSGRVVDTAGVVPADAKTAVERLSLELEQKTGAQIAVLTVESIAPLGAFDYGMAVVDRWQLGSAEKDDGLLLLVVTGKSERSIRFFQGYGLEGVLPDGKLGSILF